MKLRSQSTADGTPALVVAAAERRGGPLQSAAYAIVVALLGPIERLLIRAGMSADVATLASLVVAIFSGIAAAAGHLVLAGVLYLLAGALDLLDGRIARQTNTACPRGAALDSIVDRFSEGLVLGGLAFSLRATPGLGLCLTFLVASMGVSYARARGEGLGVSIDSGIMNRGPRVALMALAMILEGSLRTGNEPTMGFLIGLGALALLTSVTAAFRIVLLLRRLPGPAGSGPSR